MFLLFLNDMRSPQIEMAEIVARADTREALTRFIEREQVERYRDGIWWKGFRKDGPLEWFNPPGVYWPDGESIQERPSREDAIADFVSAYDAKIASILFVD